MIETTFCKDVLIDLNLKTLKNRVRWYKSDWIKKKDVNLIQL